MQLVGVPSTKRTFVACIQTHPSTEEPLNRWKARLANMRVQPVTLEQFVGRESSYVLNRKQGEHKMFSCEDPVLWFGTRVTCEMVSDGDGRFIPASIVCLHTLSLLLASLVAHDRATYDNHTHHTRRVSQTNIKEGTLPNTTRGYSI